MIAADPFSADICERLVNVLVHSLWQGVLLAAAVAVVNLFSRKQSARLRYAVSFGALLATGLCMPVTYMLVPSRNIAAVEEPTEPATQTPAGSDEHNESIVVSAFPMAATAEADGASNLAPPAAKLSVAATKPAPPTPPSIGKHASPYIVAAYVVGVLLMTARLALGLWGGERFRRSSLPVKEAQLLALLASRARALGLRVAPALATCERIAVPIVVGVIKPIILLPVAILTELTPMQLEAVLVHELAHIRRWDHVANLLQRMVEALLFFHPAVWYVSRCVSRERENCCDDMVLATGMEATGYAELLVRVAEMTQSRRAPSMSLAASGPHPTRLRERVMRILGTAIDAPFCITRAGLIISAVLCSVVGLAVALGFDREASDRELTKAEQEERSALAITAKPIVLDRAALAEARRAIAILEVRPASEPAISAAIETLTKLGPGVAELLTPLLAQGPTDVRALKVLEALAESPHVQRVLRDAVANQGQTGNTNTIHCALVALGKSRNPAHADFVAQYLTTHANAAMTTLASIGGNRARVHLVAAFNRVPTERWFVLATELGRLGDKAAVPDLKQRLAQVELPPTERFPRATVPAFIRAIHSLASEDSSSPLYSFGQGVSFRYPFAGDGSPKTFSLEKSPQAHYVRLPSVDANSPEGRMAIWTAMAEATKGPGFTIDGDSIVTFHGLIVAPLWPSGKPYPTTAYDWVNEMPHSVIRDRALDWLKGGELQDGPLAGSKTMRIPADGLLVAMDPRDNHLSVIFLRTTGTDFQYEVTVRPLDPLLQLVAANRRAFPATMGFTEKRYCDLQDLESNTKEGALNLNDALLTTMTKAAWRGPQRDAILVAEFAHSQLALGVPGVEQFLLVDESNCWDDPEVTAKVLARGSVEKADDLERVEQEVAIFYRIADAKPGRLFAFAAKIAGGVPVAGVLKLTDVDMVQKKVRMEHKFLPTALAQEVFRGQLPKVGADDTNATEKERAFAVSFAGEDGVEPAAPEAASNKSLHQAWSENSPLEFSPVRDLSIVLPKDGSPEFLNLQRAVMEAPPRPLIAANADEAKLKAWAVAHKLPLEFRLSDQGCELRTHDVQTGIAARLVADQDTIDRWPETVDETGRYKVDLSEFDKIAPRALMQSIYNIAWGAVRFDLPDSAEVAKQSRNQRWTFDAELLPAMISFWDSNGQLGLLQIQLYNPQLRLVKIRYKLVRLAK